MSHDLEARLDRLRRKLERETDPEERADLEASITAIEAQLRAEHAQVSIGAGAQTGDVAIGDVAGGDQIDRQTNQSAGGTATVGAMVGGDVSGDVQTGGVRNQALIQLFFTAAGIAEPTDDQQELVAAYLARLVQRCDRLRLSGAVRRERREAGAPALTLSQVYVTLAADRWELVREAEDADALAAELEAGYPDVVLPEAARRMVALQHDGEPALPTKRAGSPRVRLERPLLLTEALSRRKQVVLLGGPGSGKSSFLRYLAVALAQPAPAALPSGWGAGRLLPVYASLGAFAAWAQQQRDPALTGPGLWRYVLTVAQEYGLDGLDQPLKRAFRQGGLLLLLDGLDEVAEPSLRAGVGRAVAALAETGGFLAVTCRTRSFVGAVAEPFAAWGAPIDLAPFSLGQIHHFVRAWYDRSADRGAIDRDEAAERVAELSDRLARLPNLRDLGQTPLLLTIMTMLHFYEGKLPEDRADLYEDLVQLLLLRWTQQRREAGASPALLDLLKADGRLGGLKEYHLRNTLEALAYRAHQESPASGGRGLLDRHRVRGAFDDLFAEFEIGPGPAAEKAAAVLAYLEDESGLLIAEGGDLYGLPHLSYEEYLAGCYLSRQAEFRPLAYTHWQADSTRWREVIFLALGRMVRGDGRETAAGWLEFLLAGAHGRRERDDAERARAAFFAGECLAQMGGKAALIGARTVALPTLWANLARALADVVSETILPAADRVQAGVWLGELGDPRPGVCDLPPPFVAFAGGTFVIGEPKGKAQFDDEVNDLPVDVPAFELARYPVTNAQFQQFIEAGGYDPTALWWLIGADWLRSQRVRTPRYWTDARLGIIHPNHPVVGVNWYEAVAFCAWLTQHRNDGYEYVLPSEAEWEYAARGTERRVYPWGDGPEPDDERANFDETFGATTVVGCFPLGSTPEGLLDMAGNVWEWTRSAFRPYPYDPDDGRADPSDPANKRFTFRGGAWFDPPLYLRAGLRLFNRPDDHNQNVGFRLARRRK